MIIANETAVFCEERLLYWETFMKSWTKYTQVIIYNLDCWVDVEFKIFNRWGEMIYHGYDFNFSSYPFWDGSINGSEYYAVDGVYVYTFYGRREDSPEILEESGTVSIFR